MIILIVASVSAVIAVTIALVIAPAQTQTRVVTDEAAGTIVFIVAGHEQARIDSGGLHVRGDVEYGGTIRDAGQGGFDGGQMEPSHAQ